MTGNIAQISDVAAQLAELYHQQNNFSAALQNALYALKSAETLTANAEVEKKIAEINFLLAQIFKKQDVYPNSIDYLQKAQSFFQNSPRIAEWTNEIADCLDLLNDAANAEKYHRDLWLIAVQKKDKKLEIKALSKLIKLTAAQKKFADALDFSQKLSEIYEKYKAENPTINDEKTTEFLANAFQNTGYLFRQQGNLSNSALFLNKALEEFARLNQENPTVIGNIGVTYAMLGNFPLSENYFQKAIQLSNKSKNPRDLPNACNLFAAHELLRKRCFEAISWAKKAIETAEPLKANDILTDSYLILNNAYSQQGDFKQAQEYFKKSEEYHQFSELQNAQNKELMQKKWAEMQQTENDFLLALSEKEKQNLSLKQMALEAQKKEQTLQLLQQEKNLQEIKIKNQLLDKEAAEQQLKLAQQGLETERKNQEIAALEQQKQLQFLELGKKQAEHEEQKKALELEKNRNQLLESNKKLQEFEIKEGKNREKLAFWAIIGSLLILLIVLFAAWRNHKKNILLKKQQQEIAEKNAELLTSEEELRQNSEILLNMNDSLLETIEQVQQQKIIIEKKNGDIVASINYALRIQKAITPKTSDLEKHFDCFVLFSARDIVSGDFYWFAEKENHKILAVADCTGHGVSGAFMTMIGNNLLNHVVQYQGIFEPNIILNQMPKLLEKTLLHSEGAVKDGMDIGIVSFENYEKNGKNKDLRVCYSGAMNPLYFVQNGEFTEIKADKRQIDGKIDPDFSYVKHEIPIHATTTLYLCSDGFQDQFGGDKGKKFMVKNLKTLLHEISGEGLQAQKEILEKTFEQWKGSNKQTDDVLIVGIRISPGS